MRFEERTPMHPFLRMAGLWSSDTHNESTYLAGVVLVLLLGSAPILDGAGACMALLLVVLQHLCGADAVVRLSREHALK
jgi:hypothetical protein